MTKKQAEKIATKEFKNLIKQKDLIDTGRLLREANVKLVYSRNNFKMQLRGPEYLKYLDEKYSLSIEMRDNEIVTDAIATFFASEIEKEMIDLFKDFN